MDNTINGTPINETDNDLIEKIPIDSTVKLKVDDTGYEASVMFTAPINGGKDIRIEQVYELFSEKNIVAGIDKEILEDSVKKRVYGSWIKAARATPPINGDDSTTEYFFDKDQKDVLIEDDRGFVDYKDLNVVKNVYAGTPIAKVTPETAGTPGESIYGRPIAQRIGKKISPLIGENITVAEDGVTYLAKVNGHLSFSNGRFIIQPVYTIKGDVDISTGNIHFIGDIVVKGDISEGYYVKSDKSLTVYGSVYGAKVEADETVDIRGGLIGSTLTAGGAVKIEFAEKSNIECKDKLTAKSLLLCRVKCNGDINVNMGSGSIIGGEIYCSSNIFANNIGSNSYIPTQISIGENSVLKLEKERLCAYIPQCEEEIEKCKRIIGFLDTLKKTINTLPEDKEIIYKTTSNTILMKNSEISKAKMRIDEIDIILQTKQSNFIECKKDMHPGVRIIMNDFMYAVDRGWSRCRVSLGDEGVEVNAL